LELSPEVLKHISEERKEYVNHYNNLAFFNDHPDTIFTVGNNKIIVPIVVLTGNTGDMASQIREPELHKIKDKWYVCFAPLPSSR
jgi:hypothetical protein